MCGQVAVRVETSGIKTEKRSCHPETPGRGLRNDKQEQMRGALDSRGALARDDGTDKSRFLHPAERDCGMTRQGGIGYGTRERMPFRLLPHSSRKERAMNRPPGGIRWWHSRISSSFFLHAHAPLQEAALARPSSIPVGRVMEFRSILSG